MEHLLWELSVRATLLAGGIAVMLWALRIRTAAVRHGAWASVVLFMLLLPWWTAWGPKAVLRWLPPLAGQTASVGLLPASPSSPAPVNAAQSAETSGSSWSARSLAAGIYVLGLGVLLSRLLVGTVRANKLARQATNQGGRLTHASCTAPITVGWLRPRVILPDYWPQWSPAQLEAVLIHEHEHVRRYDPLVQWLALLNRAIFWFHPLAWWLERQLSALAEEACDAVVLASGHDARSYSEVLLEIARSVMRAGGRLHVTGSAMPGSFLEMRLRKILEAAIAPSISRPRALCLAASCALTTVLFAAGTLDHARKPVLKNSFVAIPAPPQAAAPVARRVQITLAQAAPKPVPVPAPQLPDFYRKWLDEEAVYIVTDEERADFLRLSSDPARQQFIAQFWSRRDAVGDPPNAFRKEHYRRIAYANDRFGFAETPGWRTARGKVYIKYGPAYTVEVLFNNGLGLGRETWFYRSIEGVGVEVTIEFVDREGNGEFGLNKINWQK